MVKNSLDNSKAYFQSAMISGINPKQKVSVVDLTSQFNIDKNLSKKDLSKYIQSLIGTKPLSSKDKKALFSFVKRSKRLGKKDIYMPDHIANSSKVETNYKGERNTAVNNITNLIQNSILIDISENKDKNGKPNVDNYLRFYTPVRINNNLFTIRITAENNKNNDIFNILNADVYDVIIDKKMPTSVLIPANKQRNLMKSASANIITDNAQNFNPNEVTIEEMLKGVVDSDGKIYYQKQNKLFLDNEQAEKVVKRIETIKGTFVPAENLIELFKGADESTIFHEFAHWWLEKLQKYAEESEELQQDLVEIRKFVN